MAIFKHKQSSMLHYRFIWKGLIKTGSTYTDDREKAEKFVENVRRELAGEENGIAGKVINIRDALTRHVAAMKGQKEHTRHSQYARKLLGSVKGEKCHGFHGDTLIHTITNGRLEKFIQDRFEEGNAANTIRYELVVLSQAFKRMARLNYRTPKIDFPALKRENNVKPTKGRLRFLSIVEENRLLEEAAKYPDTDTYAFIVTLLDTGARYNEIATLKWEHVNLEQKTVHLYRGKVGNESVLYMTDRLHKLLKQRWETRKATAQIYVFEALDKGPRKYTKTHFDKICENAKLEGVTYHILRHTHASRLVQAGLSITDVQSILGHSTPTMTMRYAHLSPQQSSKRAVDVMNKLNVGG